MQRSKVTDDEVEKSSLQYGGRGGEDERLITKTPNNGILNTVADAATATATEIARLKTRPRCRVTEEEHIMLYLLIGFPPPTPAFSVNTTHRWFPGPSGQILSSRDWKTTSYTWWWSGGGGGSTLPIATHVVSQAVSLVGHGQSGELPQSQLALHGLVCAHDEGLPRGGRESQRLDWEEKINKCNKYTLRGLSVFAFCQVRSSVEYWCVSFFFF